MGLRAELCREILRSGSQRSGVLDRDLPNRSHTSCIISCIIVDVPREIGFLVYLALSCMRVAPDRGVDGRRCGRQDRVSACRSPPDETEPVAAAVVLRWCWHRSSVP
jgi:hypothetical protein